MDDKQKQLTFQQKYKKLQIQCQQMKKKLLQDEQRMREDESIIDRVIRFIKEVIRLLSLANFDQLSKYLFQSRQDQLLAQMHKPDEFNQLMIQVQEAKKEYQRQKCEKLKDAIKKRIQVVIILFIGGGVIATCIYGVPAFVSYLSLQVCKASVIAIIGGLEIIVVAIGVFVCWGIKKLFDQLFS